MTGVSRDQLSLPPPGVRERLPTDGAARSVVAVVGWVPLGAFAGRPIRGGGQRQYPPRLLMAYADACGIVSARRIGLAACRRFGLHSMGMGQRLDHGAIATFRRSTGFPGGGIEARRTAAPASEAPRKCRRRVPQREPAFQIPVLA